MQKFPDRPTRRPYARIERERRFVLERLPDDLDPTDFRRLRDTYIEGTDLRLRRVESPDGALVQLKLGQKTLDPDAPDDPRRRRMTTFYLRPEEEATLSLLPGARSVKRRYKVLEQGWTFCIDVYEAPARAAGTVLCEVECDTDEALEAIVCPEWAREEVTEEASYTGWALATGG